MKMIRFPGAMIAFAAMSFGGVSASEICWEPLCEPGCGGAIVSLGISPHNPDHMVGGGDMLGTCVSFDGGESWSIGTGLPSYEMATPTFHPTDSNIVWMGSCMGPVKSTDGGRTWQWKRNGMPKPEHWKYSTKIEKILFHPADTNRLYAFGGSHRLWQNTRYGYGEVYGSADGGENWELKMSLKKDGTPENILDAQFSPDGRLSVVTDLSGWMGHKTPGRVTFLTFHPTDPRIVWICTDRSANEGADCTPGSIYKSVDCGRTWKRSDSGIVKTAKKELALTTAFSKVVVSAAAPNELYVCDKGWASPVIWKSVDGGANWERCLNGWTVAKACPAGVNLDLVAHPTRRGEVWGWNSEYYLRTKDGGKTWTDQSSVRPDPKGRPDNWRGRGWNGWCTRGFVFDPYRRGRSIALMMDAGHGWLSEDGLKTWRYTKTDVTAWGGGNGAAFSKNGYIYIATGQRGANAGVIVSADDGRTFKSYSGEEHGLLPRNKGGYGSIYADPDDGRRAWVLAQGTLRRTEDGGVNWSTATNLVKVSGFAGDPSTPGRFYIIASDHVWVYERGKGLKDLKSPEVPHGLMTCDAKGRILVISENEGVWRYDPADNTSRQILRHKLIGAIAADPNDANRILVGLHDYPYHDFAGGKGVLFSEDGGETWNVVNIGLPNLRITAAAFDPFDPKTIIVGTGGTGFFRSKFAD